VLQIRREIVTRRPRVDGRRVERIMSEQAGEFNQLAGIVAQITKREGVAAIS